MRQHNLKNKIDKQKYYQKYIILKLIWFYAIIRFIYKTKEKKKEKIRNQCDNITIILFLRLFQNVVVGIVSIFSHIVPEQLEWSIRWKIPIYGYRFLSPQGYTTCIKLIDFTSNTVNSKYRYRLPINVNYYQRSW